MKFEQNIRTNDRQSSKGNQLKWENEGIWYKADYTGYEGLVEYMISHLLKKSSLAENAFVCYDLEKIKYGTVIYLAKVGRLLLYNVYSGTFSEKVSKCDGLNSTEKR